jgi:seryl-tRNA synthetase
MSEITVESLTEELEKLKKALEEASKNTGDKDTLDRLAFLEGDNKKMIEARDKAKNEKRKAEEAALVENGEFKTLAESKSAEVNDLAKQIDGLNGKLEAYQVRDEEEFKAILQHVPEALREQVSDETLPLAKRLSLAKALSTQKQPPASFRQPGEPEPTTLQTQYEDAVKSNDIMGQMRLKREMHEAKE